MLVSCSVFAGLLLLWGVLNGRPAMFFSGDRALRTRLGALVARPCEHLVGPSLARCDTVPTVEGARMRILCTGITCSDRKELCSQVAADSGGLIEYVDVGETMARIASDLQLGITDQKILDAPETTLKCLRAHAFEQVIAGLKCAEGTPTGPEGQRAAPHTIIGLHATFRWRQRTMIGFDASYVAGLAPDMFVTVVDNVKDIKERLDRFPKWQGQRLQHDDILDWVDQETVVTEMLALMQRKPFYLIARKEDLRTFRNLILRPELPKVYLSYPITGAAPEHLQAVEQFAEQLREHLIVFNPLAIKDIQFMKEVAPPLPDRVNRRIESSTVYRDYRLIAQSDAVVVYYTTNVYSHGVASEINYAAANSKLVVIIWPHSQSPFLKNQADKIYSTPDEFLSDVEGGSFLKKVLPGQHTPDLL